MFQKGGPSATTLKEADVKKQYLHAFFLCKKQQD